MTDTTTLVIDIDSTDLRPATADVRQLTASLTQANLRIRQSRSAMQGLSTAARASATAVQALSKTQQTTGTSGNSGSGSGPTGGGAGSNAVQDIYSNAAKDLRDKLNKDLVKAAEGGGFGAAGKDLRENVKHTLADVLAADIGNLAGEHADAGGFWGGLLGGMAGTTSGAKDDKKGSDAKKDAVAGAAKASDEMTRIATDAGKNIRTALGEALYSALDGDFKAVGKSFKSLLAKMAADLISSQIAKLLYGDAASGGKSGGLLGVLGTALGNWFFGSTSALPEYGSNNPTGNYAASNYFDDVMAANGMAFAAGRPLTAYARGGIVSRPTLFPMLGGRGLMGEAGPEAIMPLARGSDGRLGVRAAGTGDARVVVNIQNNSGQPVQTQERQDNGVRIVDVVVGEIARNVARGGQVAQAMQQRFGLQQRGIAMAGA